MRCLGCGRFTLVSRPAAAAEAAWEAPAEAAPESVPEPEADAAPAPPPPEAESAAVQESEIGAIRFGLTSRAILLMLLVSLLPLALFGFFTLRQTDAMTRSATEELMGQTAAGLSGEVDQWVDKNVRVLKAAARLAAIGSMDRGQQEPVLKALNAEYPWMYLVFTLMPNGMNLARNDGNPVTDYADRQYYKDVMAGKELAWQTLIGRTNKKPGLVLAVPISVGGKTVGVMAAAMTIDDISRSVARWKKGNSGFAFLVDEKGKVVAHQVEEFVTSEKNLADHPLVAGFRKAKQPVTLPFTSDKGAPSLGHARGNAFGWVLAIQQDESEVFAQRQRLQLFALGLLGITVVIVLFIALISARALVRPIRSLTEVAERMSMGDLNMQIDIASRDEIGLLAQAIGRMQTSLRLAMDRLRRKR
jgi:methyl-accepting chemotaxis protein